MTRIPSLDGLRAIAIALVLMEHLNVLRVETGVGHAGVSLFFVLSGYLITGILTKPTDHDVSVSERLRVFYLRRFLRIFPAYYLLLAVLLILGVSDVRNFLGWHVFYLSNVWIAARNSFSSPVVHFWSLAVEEQFYLVWPLIVLLMPRKHLRTALIVMIVGASVFRIAGRFFLGWNFIPTHVLLPGCLDALGLGSLMAISLKSTGANIQKLAYVCMAACVPISILWLAFGHGKALVWICFEPFLAILSAGLLNAALNGFGNRFFNLAPMRYIGTISYGIYLCHMPIIYLFHESPIPSLAVTLAIASASWFLFEKPINGLKDKVCYRQLELAPTASCTEQ